MLQLVLSFCNPLFSDGHVILIGRASNFPAHKAFLPVCCIILTFIFLCTASIVREFKNEGAEM